MAMARRWTPQRFVTLRRIRVIACIAATSIALAGSFAFTARKSVALNINGQTTQVTTYAMTATRLLEEQGVDIKTHDIVTTSSGDQLANHAVVTVQSAYQTTINIDGTAVPFWTVATSADQLLGFFEENQNNAAKITVDIKNVYNQLTGGLVIETTMSRTHQDQLDKEFTKNVFPADASDGTPVQGAAACVNTQTGEVLAIVGGRSYDVRRGFNRATRLRRQPGSALKPLVAYAPAIDQYGYTTASVLKDEPTNFNGYKPRNASYTYYGNVSIRSALQSSLNVATVALLNQIGVEAGRAYLEKVGIPLDDRDSNLALALGAMTYGVSPVQLAAAYAPFGNGGVFNSPHFITKVTDASGRVLYQHRSEGERVLSEQSAFLMTSLLQSVTSSGTGAKLSAAGTPVAGKTGTVNMTGGGNRDIWMAAYNTEITCAFWMGFDEPDSSHKLQGWISGGDNTAAMARDYFKALYQNRDKPQFTRPEGIIALEIDKQAIKWRGEPMLAVDLTPKAYRYTEYFSASNYPTKKSDIWTPPRSPNNFTVGHNDSGYPLLMIQPADTAIYRVQRDTYGESFVLTELYGTAGETLYYTDTSAKPGVVYTYRVIPVHAELLNNGILLEGVQAVQVAQAKLSGAGSLWNAVRNFFGGGGEDETNAVQSMTENQRSIFWTD